MNRTITAAAALAAFALAPMAAHAKSSETPEAVTITTAGLDLSTQSGARTMLARIDSAATTACWQDKLDQMNEYRACKSALILEAVQTLHEPVLSLVYAETYSTKSAPMIVASR